MDFRTKIEIEPSLWRITHHHRGIALGSCFAESMTAHLARLKYKIVCNPFGALYNPLSVAACIERMAEGDAYTEAEIMEWQDRWFSTDAHTLMSATDKGTAIERMNSALSIGTEALAGADYVILTLGTDYVYELDGRIVANCHKLPAERFVRRRASIDEMTAALKEVIHKHLSDKQIILTVSPIRHLKDGLTESSLSKAALRIVASNLCELYENVHYFPSYEILVDELRDYRFYAADMIHPSDVAVEYIRECFERCWMEPSECELNLRIERIIKGIEHRPFDTSSDSYDKFVKALLCKIEELASTHPEIDLSAEQKKLQQEAF